MPLQRIGEMFVTTSADVGTPECLATAITSALTGRLFLLRAALAAAAISVQAKRTIKGRKRRI